MNLENSSLSSEETRENQDNSTRNKVQILGNYYDLDEAIESITAPRTDVFLSQSAIFGNYSPDYSDTLTLTDISKSTVPHHRYFPENIEKEISIRDNQLYESTPAGVATATTTVRNTNENQKYLKIISSENKLIKIWECNICYRQFQHQYTLLRHLPTHTNVRNFSCNECGKAFRQLSTLSQHKAIHSIDRPYSCEKCKKSFNRISTLISHRKTHSEVKPFQCPVCKKGFHQKGNLRNHIFIHTNERPYRCSLCSKGFNQMSNLVCHKQKSHSGVTSSLWECHRCQATFSKRSLLRAHDLEMHQIQTSTIKNQTAKKVKQSTPSHMIIPKQQFSSNPSSSTTSISKILENTIVMPAIETEAMKKANANNEIPFAVLHFLEGHPLLVRIINQDDKSILRSVNEEDFKTTQMQEQNQNAKINHPLVATIYQSKSPDGQPEFIVKPPSHIYKFISDRPLIMFGDKNNVKLDQEKNQDIKEDVSNTAGVNDFLISNQISETDDEENSMSDENLSKFFFTPTTLNLPTLDYGNCGSISNDADNSHKQPRAIAITEEVDWWKKRKADIIESEHISEIFQNIATGSLLSPGKSKTPDENNISVAIDLEETDENNNGSNINNERPDNINSNSINPLLDAIKSEGLDPDIDKIMSYFSENGIAFTSIDENNVARADSEIGTLPSLF